MAEYGRHALPSALCVTALMMIYPTLKGNDWMGVAGCVLFTVFTAIAFFRTNGWGTHYFLAGFVAISCAACLASSPNSNFAPLTVLAFLSGLAYFTCALAGMISARKEDGGG